VCEVCSDVCGCPSGDSSKPVFEHIQQLHIAACCGPGRSIGCPARTAPRGSKLMTLAPALMWCWLIPQSMQLWASPRGGVRVGGRSVCMDEGATGRAPFQRSCGLLCSSGPKLLKVVTVLSRRMQLWPARTDQIDFVSERTTKHIIISGLRGSPANPFQLHVHELHSSFRHTSRRHLSTHTRCRQLVACSSELTRECVCVFD
jgi:hypothetical protein